MLIASAFLSIAIERRFVDAVTILLTGAGLWAFYQAILIWRYQHGRGYACLMIVLGVLSWIAMISVADLAHLDL